METKGGRYTIEINGRRYSGRGKATVVTSAISRENGANADGSGFSTVKPQLCSIDLTFDRGSGLKWDEAMMLVEIDVTFVETDVGRTGIKHLFTAASWGGSPAIDTDTGEVSGLKAECPGASYTQIRG